MALDESLKGKAKKMTEQESASRMDKEVGERVRSVRNEKGLTLKDVSEKMEISDTYLGYMERGIKPWKFEYIEKCANILGVPVLALFMDDYDSPLFDIHRKFQTLVREKDMLSRRIEELERDVKEAESNAQTVAGFLVDEDRRKKLIDVIGYLTYRSTVFVDYDKDDFEDLHRALYYLQRERSDSIQLVADIYDSRISEVEQHFKKHLENKKDQGKELRDGWGTAEDDDIPF